MQDAHWCTSRNRSKGSRLRSGCIGVRDDTIIRICLVRSNLEIISRYGTCRRWRLTRDEGCWNTKKRRRIQIEHPLLIARKKSLASLLIGLIFFGNWSIRLDFFLKRVTKTLFKRSSLWNWRSRSTEKGQLFNQWILIKCALKLPFCCYKCICIISANSMQALHNFSWLGVIILLN